MRHHHDHHHSHEAHGRHGRRFARADHHGERHGAPGHERRGRGPRGGGRMFDHGELRLVVLALLAEQPRHGYEIIKEIEDRVAGAYSPSPGVIYPTLTMLEEIGHATVTEGMGKKQYAITPEGTAWMEGNQTAVNAAMARMRSVSTAHGGGPAPDITRATENLKLALRLRQARGPLTEDQVRAIATALDTAAVTIERS